MADLRQFQDLADFLCTKQRHGADCHTASLPHRQPAGSEPGCVGTAQQDPVARHEPHVFHQHVGQAIDLLLELAIGPADALAEDCRAIAMAFGDRRIDEFDARIELFGELEFGTFEYQFRPGIGRRQVVDDKPVEMSASTHVGSSAFWAGARTQGHRMMVCGPNERGELVFVRQVFAKQRGKSSAKQ